MLKRIISSLGVSALLLPLITAASGCADEASAPPPPPENLGTEASALSLREIADYIRNWEADRTHIASYDGTTDDLLTAGLGKTGLGGAAPAYVDPLHPTAAELRRNAIWTNYRAVLDILPNGGYGTLYGPNVDVDGHVTTNEGKIAGTEYIKYAEDFGSPRNVTLMVQVPTSFDKAHPCIITATSSGSRGVYGAIGASGEWGLKHNCAVAYTDKGTGNGLHDLDADTVNLIDGTRTTAATAGGASFFTAPITAQQRTDYTAAFPFRVAYKHAHSQQNPEKDWGHNTLRSIEFALFVLNNWHGTPWGSRPWWRPFDYTAANTTVIASGISNGAGAALAAASEDALGLIDGVAVTEPQIQVGTDPRLTIEQGGASQAFGKSLYDYFTYANLYQACAVLSTRAVGSPFAVFLSAANSANRCNALHAKGLVAGETTAAQAEDAMDRLHAYGWLSDSDLLQSTHFRFATNSIAVTYANAYGRFDVTDNVCGFSFANTDALGAPIAQNPALEAAIFATGNGVPPSSGINIVFNDAVGGARLDFNAVSPSSGLADFALDGALCLRSLAMGVDTVTGAPLTGDLATRSFRVRAGVAESRKSADINRIPAVVIQGRSDTLIPINQASRAWYASNQLKEGNRSNAHFYEVTNGQHFDSFLGFPGYDSNFIPLHKYLIDGLDLVWNHLRHGAPLPASQVVRTTPRGGSPGLAPAITAANVPPIAATPSTGDAITYSARTLHVPN